jgi:hypothetical protein
MRFLPIFVLTCALCSADTITNPLFGGSDPNVIGPQYLFNIQSISVTVANGNVTAVLNINFDDGQSNNLAPFQDGALTLQTGDLFFYNPADPNSYQYGVPMYGSRPNSAFSFTPGALYFIGGTGVGGNGITTETAQTALGNPSVSYRPNQTVLMIDNTSAPTAADAGNGVSIVANGGDGGTFGEYTVTVQFADTLAFNSAVVSGGQFGVAFSAADCGNAILSGQVSSPTPEPGSLALFGVGVAVLGFTARRRNRSTK